MTIKSFAKVSFDKLRMDAVRKVFYKEKESQSTLYNVPCVLMNNLCVLSFFA